METLGQLFYLGDVYRALEQYEKAGDYYQQALTNFRAENTKNGEYRSLYNLGIVYQNLKEFERAREFYEQALVIARVIKEQKPRRLGITSVSFCSWKD